MIQKKYSTGKPDSFSDATDKLLGPATGRDSNRKKINYRTRRSKNSQINRGKIIGTKNKSVAYAKPENNTRKSNRSNSLSLKIIPLGGQEEVGRNMTIFEYDKDIVILDMGIQFPEEDMPGIDYIIPNVNYLKGKERNIRAVIFSHGHLDHIGAAPILLEKLANPMIIGSDLTLALIKNRQEDYKKGSSAKLKTLQINNFQQRILLGRFTAKFFPVEHSIAQAVGLILETPEGTVIHPGDWTLEKNPTADRPRISYEQLSRVRRPAILMLESLGVAYTENRVSETTMHTNLQKLISEADGRVIIGTFSSQVERIRQVIEYAERINKKVALDGYSMKLNIKVSQELGYVKPHKNTLIDIGKISDYANNKIIIICTGAQGESNAVLSRIISGNHKHIKIQKDDTIIFSSSVIPGNERTIQRLKDNLYRLCDNVIHSDIMDVHSGGHSNQADIAEVLQQVKPDFFLPVYANHYMLKETQKLAYRLGFGKHQVQVLDNGSIFELKNRVVKVTHGTVLTDYVFVDGLGIGDISNVVLRDRQVMSTDGMLVVIATIDKKTGKLINNPDLISRGFIYMKENKKLVEDTRKKAIDILKNVDPRTEAQATYIKDQLRNQLGKFLFQKTERRPMILPVIIEV